MRRTHHRYNYQCILKTLTPSLASGAPVEPGRAGLSDAEAIQRRDLVRKVMTLQRACKGVTGKGFSYILMCTCTINVLDIFFPSVVLQISLLLKFLPYQAKWPHTTAKTPTSFCLKEDHRLRSYQDLSSLPTIESPFFLTNINHPLDLGIIFNSPWVL